MSHSTLFYNVSVLTVSVFEITKEFYNAQGSSTMFRRCPVLAQICAEKKNIMFSSPKGHQGAWHKQFIPRLHYCNFLRMLNAVAVQKCRFFYSRLQTEPNYVHLSGNVNTLLR